MAYTDIKISVPTEMCSYVAYYNHDMDIQEVEDEVPAYKKLHDYSIRYDTDFSCKK